jgi:hypothetical protein
MRATGKFDVTVTPEPPASEAARAAGLSRLSIAKQFHGAMEGSSWLEMLALGDGRTSGGYVAIEQFTGTLGGRTGSFALLHRSLMRDGTPEGWTIAVVPGSGKGDLAGIDGSMTITIEGKRHEYAFEYTLGPG